MEERRKKSRKTERKTAEGRESYLINLAMEQAEAMLLTGKAPAQIVTHFLKLGTEKVKYEIEKLKADTKLAMSKSEHIEFQQNSEEIAAKALEAFKKYSGHYEDEEDDYDDY